MTSSNASTSTKPLDVAIVGGGIAGIVLAIGLMKLPHVHLRIYEAAHTFGEIGAGIGFGPNAIRAMQLVDPRIVDGLKKTSNQNFWDSFKNKWMIIRHGDDQGPGAETGTIIQAVDCPGDQQMTHRAHFLDELVKILPVESRAQFGKRAISLEELPADGGVKINFKDGTSATHRIIVGCDGVHSAVRPFILGADNPACTPRFSHHISHRGVIPIDKAIEVMGEELAMNGQLFMGPQGHFITVPVDKGTASAVTLYTKTDTWLYDHTKTVVPSTKEEMHADFSEWGGLVHGLIDQMKSHDIWGVFDYSETGAPTYYKGKSVIIGDAAHASTPHQGSGAGMAIEDAYVLVELFREAGSDEGMIEKAFKGYDAVRRPWTDKLMKTSREAGQLWDGELEGVGKDWEKVAQNANTRMRWIWEEDLEAEVVEAKKVMLG